MNIRSDVGEGTNNRQKSLTAKITLSNASLDSVVGCLKHYGICILPNYFGEKFCQHLLDSCVERAEVAQDTIFEDGSYRRFDCYKGTGAEPNKRVYHVDCFAAEGVKFKQDQFLRDVASKYYGSPHSVHVCLYERHQYSETPLRGFHIDTFEKSTFKAFLYLSNVTINDGPTGYILKTHRDHELRRKKETKGLAVISPGDPSQSALQTNFSKEELEEVIANYVPVVAAAGTVVLFDTWGVHKGLPVTAGGDRHVAVNYYREGSDLPRSDFGFDVEKDTKRFHGRKGLG